MRISFTLLLMLVFSLHGMTQDAIDKTTKTICKCIGKNEKKLPYDELLASCIESGMFDHMNEIKDYYAINSISDLDTEDLGRRLGIRIIKNCPAAYKYYNKDSLSKNQEFKDYETNKSLDCSHLRLGKYYYVTPNTASSYDTTHVVFDNDQYLELIGNDNRYSKLSIKWTGRCKLQLTFIESNDPFKNALSKKGDKYEYEVVQDYPDFMVLKMVFHGDEYFIEYYKE